MPDLLPSVIDVEASGFGPDSYPIEVGLVLPDGESYCSLVRPTPAWTHWDSGAEAVHKVKRETLLAHGRSVLEVADQINALLAGQVVYCDAWYHDLTWLSRLFEAAGRVQAFRLDDLRVLLNEAQSDACWHETRSRIQNTMGLPRHRASNDARILQLTLQQVRRTHPSRKRTGV